MSAVQRYKLVFFVPPLNLPNCRQAIFATGAGVYGKYRECCFTTPGIGQFKPGADANPVVGERGQLEEVGEVRCEIICGGEKVTREAVKALKSSHPYEEVAYEVYRVEDF